MERPPGSRLILRVVEPPFPPPGRALRRQSGGNVAGLSMPPYFPYYKSAYCLAASDPNRYPDVT